MDSVGQVFHRTQHGIQTIYRIQTIYSIPAKRSEDLFKFHGQTLSAFNFHSVGRCGTGKPWPPQRKLKLWTGHGSHDGHDQGSQRSQGSQGAVFWLLFSFGQVQSHGLAAQLLWNSQRKATGATGATGCSVLGTPCRISWCFLPSSLEKYVSWSFSESDHLGLIMFDLCHRKHNPNAADITVTKTWQTHPKTPLQTACCQLLIQEFWQFSNGQVFSKALGCTHPLRAQSQHHESPYPVGLE